MYYWAYRYLPRDLKYLGEGGYNDGIQVEDDLYKIWLDSSRVWAYYRFQGLSIEMVYICVEYFVYKEKDTKRPTLNGEVFLEQNRTHDISELSEFHSWMKRLDEIKGARPTYWCK